MERLRIALTTIQRLADQWPTDADLLADGSRHGPKVTKTRDTTALPFYLDRITNTEHSTRTRDGAIVVLRRVWQQWDKPKPPENMGEARWDEYKALCAALIAYLPQLKAKEVETALPVLEKLAQDTVRQTAHGLEPSPFPCPDCRTVHLGRPYTENGLLDLLVCERCQRHYSLDELNTLSKAHARYGDVNMNVTLKEAAEVLDVPLKTLSARVTRHNVKPVAWRGKRKLYKLRDIR